LPTRDLSQVKRRAWLLTHEGTRLAHACTYAVAPFTKSILAENLSALTLESTERNQYKVSDVTIRYEVAVEASGNAVIVLSIVLSRFTGAENGCGRKITRCWATYDAVPKAALKFLARLLPIMTRARVVANDTRPLRNSDLIHARCSWIWRVAGSGRHGIKHHYCKDR
jgi:hypothetical protein